MSVPRPDKVEGVVVAYTTRWCGYCVAARRLLDKRGIDFAEFDVSGDVEARRWLRELSGQPTVPQIFIHGRSIGGYVELRAMDSSGDLAAALAS